MSCIKRQAEEFVEFCEKKWEHIFKTDGYLKVGLLYSIKIFSEAKRKDYSKLQEKIKKDAQIETKKYIVYYDGQYIKIYPKPEKIKPAEPFYLKEEYIQSMKDAFDKAAWQKVFKES